MDPVYKVLQQFFETWNASGTMSGTSLYKHPDIVRACGEFDYKQHDALESFLIPLIRSCPHLYKLFYVEALEQDDTSIVVEDNVLVHLPQLGDETILKQFKTLPVLLAVSVQPVAFHTVQWDAFRLPGYDIHGALLYTGHGLRGGHYRSLLYREYAPGKSISGNVTALIYRSTRATPSTTVRTYVKLTNIGNSCFRDCVLELLNGIV